MNEVDWKLKLMQVLHCVGDRNQWYADLWRAYGINDDETELICEAFDEYYENRELK